MNLPLDSSQTAKAGRVFRDSTANSAETANAAKSSVDKPAIAAEEHLVHLTKAPLRIQPSLLKGYDALKQGDLATAKIEYARAQQADPNNTDVLQGLATIALREQKPEQAAAIYQKILDINPQDATASAALLNLRDQMNPAAAEDRLKTLAADQPTLAAPAFALGNLYARQNRWPEAQDAYFRAYNAEPTDPDILYNLAISLEHLQQSKLATQYYAQAIAAAQNRPAGFDPAQAEARLHVLQP